jgi:hypothetical protein
MAETRRQLPSLPNPDNLRKQAKSRLLELRLRAPSARLAEAQHLIAREYGFANWAQMQAEVARRRESPAAHYGRIRRLPLAVPGRNEDQGEPQIMNHFLIAGASTSILWVLVAAIGIGLMIRSGTDAPYGVHFALALLHKSH